MTKLNFFTSELIIDAEKKVIEDDLVSRAEELAESLGKDFDWYNNRKLTKKGYDPLKTYSFVNKDYVDRVCKEYSEKRGLRYIDATSCVKGLFLQSLYQTVQYDFLTDSMDMDLYKEKFLISFGGDMFGTDLDYTIEVEGSPVRLKPTRAPYYCFTSGNYGRRANHILEEGKSEWRSLTVCGTLDPYQLRFPEILAFIDCYTTNCYAHQDPSYFLVPNPRFIDHLTHIWINLNGEIKINPILVGKGGVQWFI